MTDKTFAELSLLPLSSITQRVHATPTAATTEDPAKKKSKRDFTSYTIAWFDAILWTIKQDVTTTTSSGVVAVVRLIQV